MQPLISNTFSVSALKEGKDAYVLDLTNQMNSIPVDANGKVTYATTLTTVARIMKGADYVRESIGLPSASSLKIGDVTPTVTNNGGLVTIEWKFTTAHTLTSERYVKTIQMTHDGKSYSADYVARTDKSGAIYDLLTSMTEVPFVRDSDYKLIPEKQTIYCGYTKNQNGTITSFNGKTASHLSNIDSKYYIYYRMVNGNGTFGNWTNMTTSGIEVKNSDTYAGIEFVFSSATAKANVADSNIIDRETVPIVRQSERGYGIVTSVQRDNFTEAQWNTNPGYGVVGHEDTWGSTSGIRNNARIGDLFTVVGKATDTGNGHTATYRCTNSSGDLKGICIAHQIAKAGETAFTADISNEADLFGTDASGKVIEAQQRSTKGHLFYGTKRQTLSKDPTVSLTYASSGSAVPSTVAAATTLTGKDTEEANITITLKANQTITDAIYADITLQCDKGTKVCRFTLKPVKSGSNGVSPELWQLALDKDDLSFSRNDDNSLYPDSITLHAYAEKTVGATTTRHTSAVTGLSISWGYDEEDAQETSKAIGTAISVSNSTAASKRSVWVELYQSGVSGWIDRETVPINKDGKVGETGNGIKSVTLYRMFTMVFSAPSITDSGWISENNSNYPTPSGLTKEKRYLWQKKVTTYEKTSTTYEISLVAQLDSGICENLLEDTGFNSEGQMEAWELISKYVPDTLTVESGAGIKNGTQGHNAYYDKTAYGSDKLTYKEVLKQKVWEYGTNGIKKIEYSEWYTFSFWVKGTSYTKLITYIYPSCVNQSADFYIDGVKQSSTPSDAAVSWNVTGSWVRHSVTFKTKNTFYNSSAAEYSTQAVLFRLLPAGTSYNEVYICMPKLEKNTIATDWVEHTNDRMADDIQHVFVGEWSSGTTYFYGGGTGVRHVVRARKSATGAKTYFRMKKRTTSQGYYSIKEPYSDTAYWEQADYLKFVATDFLLADEAIIKFAQTNRILVYNSSGSVAAGMGGAQGGNDDYPLWVGANYDNRSKAPFRVTLAGKMYATDAEISGKITASSGKIGLFNIDNSGLYYHYNNKLTGDQIANDIWKENNPSLSSYYKDWISILRPGKLLLQGGNGYFSAGDISRLKIGIGIGADPEAPNEFLNTAYFFRATAESWTYPYYPNVRIVNSGAIGVGLRVEGGVQVWGGLIEKGIIQKLTSQGTAYLVSLVNGTTILAYNTSGGDTWISLPTRSKLISQLGISTTTEFCVPVRVINTNKSNGTVYVKVGDYDKIYNQNGDEWKDDNNTYCQVKLTHGDSITIALCYVNNTYFGQVINESR